jgi:hypothetical protein
MVGIEINKKNHEKLMAIRDEEGLKSFNDVLTQILPKGSVSPLDYEQEQPAFILMSEKSKLNISWNELKQSEVGTQWSNGEKATLIYKDNLGSLIRFEDEYGEIYLNYFHFL